MTEPWLPAASIPILITLLTTLLFQLSSRLAPKDGNAVVSKSHGEKLKRSCSSEGNKAARRGAFCPALRSASKTGCLHRKQKSSQQPAHPRAFSFTIPVSGKQLEKERAAHGALSGGSSGSEGVGLKQKEGKISRKEQISSITCNAACFGSAPRWQTC